MTKTDFQVGDIVVHRDGTLGIYIEKDDRGIVIFANGGYEEIEVYEDDLTYYEGEPEGDIMQVYRAFFQSEIISFFDYDEGDLIFERDETWENPDLAAKAIEKEKNRQEWLEKQASMPKEQSIIEILTQAFYGNRTVTQISREHVDSFILGYIDHIDFDPEREDIDRTMILVPGTDNLVIIYNKYKEEERLEEVRTFDDSFFNPPRPLAMIPELGLELYSRCIVCRRDENGELQSLEDEDYSKFMKYMLE